MCGWKACLFDSYFATSFCSNGLFLVLFTRDAFFYQYELIERRGDDGSLLRIDTQLVHQVSMAGVAADPLLLSLLPSAGGGATSQSGESSEASSTPSRRRRGGRDAHQLRVERRRARRGTASGASAQRHTTDQRTGNSLPNMYSSATCLVLNNSGELSLTNAENNQQITLATAVEQFWLSSHDSSKRDVGSKTRAKTPCSKNHRSFPRSSVTKWYLPIAPWK